MPPIGVHGTGRMGTVTGSTTSLVCEMASDGGTCSEGCDVWIRGEETLLAIVSGLITICHQLGYPKAALVRFKNVYDFINSIIRVSDKIIIGVEKIVEVEPAHLL